MQGETPAPLQNRCGMPCVYDPGQKGRVRQQQAHRPKRQIKKNPESIGTGAITDVRRYIHEGPNRPGRQCQHAEDEADAVIKKHDVSFLLGRFNDYQPNLSCLQNRRVPPV